MIPRREVILKKVLIGFLLFNFFKNSLYFRVRCWMEILTVVLNFSLIAVKFLRQKFIAWIIIVMAVTESCKDVKETTCEFYAYFIFSNYFPMK